ncbi:hypothetical protein [Heyndrickxia oleronia]|uniref:hypothetical protein n=1 Tax=Heyndrickxia oleronia TaxID=38875 RepID=UPI001C0EA4B9|nr:hypothetical protein [Heyndrickxia oleronia]MBU5212476.1 hypothetical protein [Heyndrickxia oleronia]
MNLFEELIEEDYDLQIDQINIIDRPPPKMSLEKLETKVTSDQPSSLAQYIGFFNHL